MPKKKPIAKRLKQLFQDITPEEAPVEPKRTPRKRSEEEAAPKAAEDKPVPQAARPLEMVTRLSEAEPMSLAFQMGQSSWATLQVVDEVKTRRWTPDEQLLVKQVTDQLSLALENARLFRETQSRAEELVVLNEMGNELPTKLDVSAICGVIYKYASRLMDTRFFYVAIYDEKTKEKTYPIAFENGQSLTIETAKVTGTGLTDYIIQNRKPIFAPDNVLGHMKSLGIDFVALSKDVTPSKCWLGVPMMIGERVLGVIAVQSIEQAFLYDEHDRDILTTIASQAAIAVENARLFQEAQRRAQETAALAEVGREISSTLDIKVVLQRISEYAINILQGITVAVYLPDEKFNTLIPVAVIGEEAEEILNAPLMIGSGILGNVAKTKQGEIANDISLSTTAITIEGTESVVPDEHLMAVPIMSQERVTGVLAIWRVGKDTDFNLGEFAFLSSLAQQAAIAIENARLFQEAQRRAQEMAALAEVGREISATLQVENILEKIAAYAKELLQAESTAVYLPDANLTNWRAIAVLGSDAEEIKNDSVQSGRGILGGIIVDKKGRIVNDASNDSSSVTITGTFSRNFEHIMGMPILSMDRVTGLMSIWRTGEGKDFKPTELDFLGSLAQQAAIAIDNARLYQQEQYRRQVADTLSELARIASSSLNLTDVVHRLLEQLPRLISFRTASIQLIHPDGRRQQIGGLSKDADRTQTLDAPGTYFLRKVEDDALISEIVRTREPVIIEDTYNDPRWEVLPETQSIHSWLGAPLLVGTTVVGILILDDNVAYAYNQSIADLVRSFTPQAAIAIQNASLFENIKESQEQLSEALRIARIGYFEIDLQSREITFTEELLSLLGTTAEKEGGYHFPLNQALEKFVLADDIQIATKAVQDAITGAEYRSDVTSEVRYRTVDGKVIWVSSIYKVECDAQGQPIKVAGSSQDITERKTNELTQAAINQIAESALISKNIDELYQSIHSSIKTLLPAENFFIASYDQGSRTISFPYHADEFDEDWSPRRLGKGLTSYVIRTGKPLLITPEIFSDLEASGEIVNDGATGADWLGVPLRSKQVINGVIAIQTYDTKIRITEKHREMFSVLAPQVASAIERFLAEREIQKFKLGIDRSDNAVFITDLDGKIEYANPAFEKVYGYKPEEAVGNTPRILKSGQLPDDQYKHFWGTLLSGETVSGEIINRTKDGRIIPISGTNTPILDENGKTIGFLAVHQDITQRKLQEQALQRRNTYLAASSEIGRLVTSTLDLNTIFTRTVSLISERFGFYFAAIYIIEENGFSARIQEAKGEAGEKMKVQKHSFVVGSPTIVGRVAESGESLLVNNTEKEALYQPNPLLLDTRAEIAIPLRVGARIIGVIDIQSTEESAFSEDDASVLQSLADQVAVAIDNARSYELSQQLIKDLRELDALKSQFLANMSHELRTPLNSIIGFSRVIIKGIDGPITEMQMQDLTAIYNSGQHLLGLINDILDLARIEAGKMELNFEEVHLAEMVTSVMSTAKGLVKEKPIQLVSKVPADMPTARGDTMRVRQVLINLLSNASKFTDEGTITVETKVQPGPNGKPEVIISVIDTGPGISPEGQEKLFKAFSQVDGSATRKSGGSGLGLSICANLIQLHGGRISVYSEEGKGSTFWFTLPLFHQPTNEIPEGKKIVLAIDDDPQVISLYERYLNPQGYFVVPLTEPAKAKERILELKPFAVTLDIMMPGIDGWTVLTNLKSDPDTRDYPVVICSIMEQSDKGFSLGAADYLVKPILEDDLVHALNRLNKNGDIQEVLVIDDDPNDLRLIEKLLTETGQYKPILAEGGRKGWELINQNPPSAIILDIFMPDMDGFMILEKMRENPLLRDIPVLVVSGGGLTNEQHQQLNDFGQRLITKGSLKETELIANIENALNRIDPGSGQGK